MRRQFYFKTLFIVCALIVAVSSILYTNRLVKQISEEEKRKVDLWARATRLLVTSNNIDFLLDVIQANETVPCMIVDAQDNIGDYKNVKLKEGISEKEEKEALENALRTMKNSNKPIEVEFAEGKKNYIYYGKSILLQQLGYYPYFQLGIIALFIFLGYLAMTQTMRVEQDLLWIGLTKETAHQLGTPLSSLLAWHELLKTKIDMSVPKNEGLLIEMRRDIKRLEIITERFSNIGSKPVLGSDSVTGILNYGVEYLKKRIATQNSSVDVELQNALEQDVNVKVNRPLFDWVIENLVKNSLDALPNGKGKIIISSSLAGENVCVDITDTGKGIPKRNFRKIFKPGFTTKTRGWGLGLSLAKRIIEDYHKGKIFVESSVMNKGTTIRIALPLQASKISVNDGKNSWG